MKGRRQLRSGGDLFQREGPRQDTAWHTHSPARRLGSAEASWRRVVCNGFPARQDPGWLACSPGQDAGGLQAGEQHGALCSAGKITLTAEWRLDGGLGKAGSQVRKEVRGDLDSVLDRAEETFHATLRARCHCPTNTRTACESPGHDGRATLLLPTRTAPVAPSLNL